jgi:hypothetical protein
VVSSRSRFHSTLCALQKQKKARVLSPSVKSFQVPATPKTCACPPSRPSVPTSRATRVGAQLVGHKHIGCEALFLEQLSHQSRLSRRRCTSRSRTSPSSSTARQSQNSYETSSPRSASRSSTSQ